MFYKIPQMVWKERDKYKGIINIMGGFHIFLVNLQILYKECGLLGLIGWWVKLKMIADGSVKKALDEWHCSRGMQSHKKTFRALVHFKCKSRVVGKGVTRCKSSIKFKESQKTHKKSQNFLNASRIYPWNKPDYLWVFFHHNFLH